MSLKDFDLAKLIEQQFVFSIFAHGEGPRLEGVLAEARSKLERVEYAPPRPDGMGRPDPARNGRGAAPRLRPH